MDYLFYLGTLISVWIIASLAVNLVTGYTGMIAMGHAAYLGIGAYTAATLNVFFGMNYFLAMVIAMLVTAFAAAITLLPMLRLNGLYFALAMLGLNFVFYDTLHNFGPRVEGTEGLFGLQLPVPLTLAAGRFAITALIMVACVLVAARLVGSPLGRLLRATRDRPDAVCAIGKNPVTYQIIVWSVSGALIGLAGALYAATLFYIDPSLFTLDISVVMLVFIGLGGLASISGSILGPILVIAFSESLRFIGLPSQFIGAIQQGTYGLLLIMLMIFRRQGLMGNYDFKD